MAAPLAGSPRHEAGRPRDADRSAPLADAAGPVHDQDPARPLTTFDPRQVVYHPAMPKLPPIVLVFAALSLATLRAEDWPHWRGPSASGESSERGLPTPCSDTENTPWQSPIPGLAISSPLVA